MESLLKHFEDYFNITLKEHLKYPETFKVTVNNNVIILNSNQRSELVTRISKDYILKENLTKEVTRFSRTKNYNVTDLSIGINRKVYNIYITFSSLNELINIDYGALATMAKHIIKLDELFSFCTVFTRDCDN